MTPEAARDRLRRVALAVTEASEPAAVARFLERLAAQEDAEELRAALVLAGALALLRERPPIRGTAA
jgi:hypothetical protein